MLTTQWLYKTVATVREKQQAKLERLIKVHSLLLAIYKLNGSEIPALDLTKIPQLIDLDYAPEPDLDNPEVLKALVFKMAQADAMIAGNLDNMHVSYRQRFILQGGREEINFQQLLRAVMKKHSIPKKEAFRILINFISEHDYQPAVTPEKAIEIADKEKLWPWIGAFSQMPRELMECLRTLLPQSTPQHP